MFIQSKFNFGRNKKNSIHVQQMAGRVYVMLWVVHKIRRGEWSEYVYERR